VLARPPIRRAIRMRKPVTRRSANRSRRTWPARRARSRSTTSSRPRQPQTTVSNATTLNTQTQNHVAGHAAEYRWREPGSGRRADSDVAERPIGVDVGQRAARATQPGQLPRPGERVTGRFLAISQVSSRLLPSAVPASVRKSHRLRRSRCAEIVGEFRVHQVVAGMRGNKIADRIALHVGVFHHR